MEQGKRSRGRPRTRRKDYGLRQDAKGTWHCDFYIAGTRIQRSTFTHDRAQAEEWCATTADRAWRETKLGEAPTLTWAEAVVLWLKSKQSDGMKGLANEVDKARLFGPDLDAFALHTLTTKQIDDLLDRHGSLREWTNATRNRHRSFVVGVLNWCAKKGYKTPTIAPERRKEPSKRIRYLTREEVPRLLAELPLHLYRMVAFSLQTGLRQANVTGLQWSEVDLDRRVLWVWADTAKGKKNISIPLSDEAVATLLAAKSCPQHGHPRYVFTYFGNTVEQPANSGWFKALARAGIENFRWHDLRHTWASWHVMGLMSADGTSTPLPVLQQLGGWADIKMVMKYAHLAPNYTAAFVGNSGIGPQVIRATKAA